MAQPDAEELYARSRVLFIDLMKLGLSLSTGIVAALSVIVLNQKDGKPAFAFTAFQKGCYYWCLVLLAFAIFFALTGWTAQAMYYTAWATDVTELEEEARKKAEEAETRNGQQKNKKERKVKWSRMRNIAIWCFAFFFILGITAAALFLLSFVHS